MWTIGFQPTGFSPQGGTCEGNMSKPQWSLDPPLENRQNLGYKLASPLDGFWGFKARASTYQKGKSQHDGYSQANLGQQSLLLVQDCSKVKQVRYGTWIMIP